MRTAPLVILPAFNRHGRTAHRGRRSNITQLHSPPPMPVTARGLEGIVAAETASETSRAIGQLIYCGYDINELAGKVS